MKKSVKALFLIFILVIGTLGIAGCAKAKKFNYPIIGTWEYVDSNQFIYVFNEDGTGKYIIAGTEISFTYEVKGNQIAITYTGETEPFDTEYSIKDDVLTIKDSLGEDTSYKKK